MNDDELDALLQPTHLDDAGFTENVALNLPPPRRKAPRFAILFGATALGIVIAFVASAPRGFMTLIESLHNTQSWLAPAIVLASVVAGLTGAALTEATSRA